MLTLCLGPRGSNGYEAALKSGAKPEEIVFCSSNKEILVQAERDHCRGVVPIETSYSLVGETINWWVSRRNKKTSLQVVGEVNLPVQHCLLARRGVSLASLEGVISHPQALSQCSQKLRKLGLVNQIPALSTAKAAMMVSADITKCRFAALASDLAGKIYGLKVLRKHVEDSPINVTRFQVLGFEQPKKASQNRTALLFWIDNSSGALLAVLQVFSKRLINTIPLYSVAIGKPGEYAFYIEANTDLSRGSGRVVSKLIHKKARHVLVLGSYPKA